METTHRLQWSQRAPDVPYGMCWCGCGNKAPISPNTVPRNGYVTGCPRRYIKNHHRRKSGAAYSVEDRGYVTPCWIWQRGCDRKGYGITWRGGRRVAAHRAYFEEKHGPLPDDIDTHHKCDVKPCINTEHITALGHGEHSALHNLKENKFPAPRRALRNEEEHKLRQLRSEGWKYEDLAAMFRVSKSTVGNIVNRPWTGADLDLSEAAAAKVGLTGEGKGEVSVVTSPTPSGASEGPEIVELPATGGIK